MDGSGLSSYGDCYFVLRDEMIAHRASVYEENSARCLKRHRYEPLPGHRAAWRERGKLCVAKLGGSIGPTTSDAQFQGILMREGPTSGDDDFVEVHIWGSMNMRTVERVVTQASPRRKAFRKALRDRLRGLGVVLEEKA